MTNSSTKYKLINRTTNEEHLCDKVTIDGWDYYESDNNFTDNDYLIKEYYHTKKGFTRIVEKYNYSKHNFGDALSRKKVIATNNPNLDIPKVVDEVMSKVLYPFSPQKAKHFIAGYNKSQETHPNSDEDTIKFAEWVDEMGYTKMSNGLYKSLRDEEHRTMGNLLLIWKSQRPKTVYYK